MDSNNTTNLQVLSKGCSNNSCNDARHSLDLSIGKIVWIFLVTAEPRKITRRWHFFSRVNNGTDVRIYKEFYFLK